MTWLPEIPVRFVYLGDDGREHLDTEFDAICVSVPRVGEMVIPDSGSNKVVVHSVYHRFVLNEDMDASRPVQYITVVLREP